MHILFAGGGTAGHINPALAVAGYIKTKQPDAKLSYIGKDGGLEATLVADAGIDFYPIKVEGFQRSLSLNNIKRNVIALQRVFSASNRARRLLRELKPDIVMGTGGYVSGPVLREAAKLGIKTVIHEQNAFPGVTTKMLTSKVDRVMLAMPEAEKHLTLKNKPVITGNPVRESVLHGDPAVAKAKLGAEGQTVVLSFGGSLGARPINDAVAGFISKNHKRSDIYFLHATGKNGYEKFIEKMKSAGVDLSADNIDIRPYISDMDICMAAADLVVCRAGAITLSELQICGKASVLIPSPYVAENHQYHNAMTLVNAGAASIIEEKDLSTEALDTKISSMIFSKESLSIMGAKAKACGISDANERIYKVITEVLGS